MSAPSLAAIGIALGALLAVQGVTSPSQGAVPQPAGTGAITGTVIDGPSGAPLSDVIVSIVPQSGAQLPSEYQPRQITDAKGRFAFQSLPNGQFQIIAAKYGYLDGGHGRDNAPTDALRTIAVEGGSWISNVRVPIWKPAVISGTVRDETGEPVVGVLVRALARIRVAGRDELAAGPVVMTDDHGRYRIPGLLAGRYIVQVPSVQMSVPAGTRTSAPAGNAAEGVMDVDDSTRLFIGRYPLPPPRSAGRPLVYGAAFHPSANSANDASTVDLQFGADRPAVDITLTPVPTARVSGVVEGPPEALSNLTVRLLPAGMENLGMGSEVATALVGANGTFTFLNVAAGAYTIDAPMTFNELRIASGGSASGASTSFGSNRASLPSPSLGGGMSTSWQSTGLVPGVLLSSADLRGATGAAVSSFTGRASVTVGAADVAGLVVRLRSGAVVRGRLVFESDPLKPLPPTTRASVFLDPADGRPTAGQPRALVSPATNPEFEISRVVPGEYFIRVQTFLGGPYWVKSVQWRGQEYSAAPLDATGTTELSGVVVTMTSATPVVTGSVRRQDGSAPPSSLVIVFPAQEAQRVNTGLWPTRLVSTAVSSDGTFKLDGLPAGDYFIAAIQGAQSQTWRDPGFLALAERQATRVTLTWGQTARQDLTLAVVR